MRILCFGCIDNWCMILQLRSCLFIFSISLCIPLSIALYISLCIPLCIPLSIALCIPLCIALCISFCIPLYIALCIPLFILGYTLIKTSSISIVHKDTERKKERKKKERVIMKINDRKMRRY
jgi:predicted membrane protein